MATTFTNQASLSLGGGQILSNVASGVMQSALEVSKYAVQQSYSAGDEITYVVSIVNNSDADLSGLTVSDDLGAYPFNTGSLQPLSYVDGSAQYYSNGVLQPAPTVSTANGLVFENISVPAGGNAALIYSAAVNSYASPQTGAAINNTVTIGSAKASDADATESIAVTNAALPSLIKSVSPIPVAENGSVTYTIQLVNNGNTAILETDGAIITDTFDPILSNISVTLDGAALTAAEYAYDEATGEFSTADGVITVPAASFSQDPVSGEWSAAPGTATLTITGTLGPVT